MKNTLCLFVMLSFAALNLGAVQAATNFWNNDIGIVPYTPSPSFDFSCPPDIKWLKQQAEHGDPYYQGLYAMYCFDGYFMKGDMKSAKYWARQSAAQYHPFGLCVLVITETSHPMSLALKEKLSDAITEMAEEGDAEAQVILASMYGDGFVTTNLPLAVYWYQQAVEQGYACAQWYLGNCYFEGKGVAKNETEASRWFRLAAEQGWAKAQNDLGFCCFKGKGVAKNLPESVRWFRLAAEQGWAKGQLNLGKCYLQGKGVARNRPEAIRLFRLAAEQGNTHAQFKLFFSYKYGIGVPKNKAEADMWIKKAANGGDLDACLHLTADAMHTLNFQEAEIWLKKAERINANDFGVKLFGLSLALVNMEKFSTTSAVSPARYIAFLLGGLGLIIELVLIGIMFWKSRTGIVIALGWMFFFLIGQSIALIVFLFLPATGFMPTGVIMAILFTAITLPVIVGSLGRQRALLWKWPVPESGIPRGKLLACIVLSGFCIAIAAGWIYEYGYTWMTGSPSPVQPTVPLIQNIFKTAPILSVLCIAVLVPIAEEIIFRGLLDNALQRYLRPWFSIAVTALLFALIHLQPEFMPQLFFMGVVLGWTKYKTGTLWAPVLLHILNNGYVCYLLALGL